MARNCVQGKRLALCETDTKLSYFNFRMMSESFYELAQFVSSASLKARNYFWKTRNNYIFRTFDLISFILPLC